MQSSGCFFKVLFALFAGDGSPPVMVCKFKFKKESNIMCQDMRLLVMAACLKIYEIKTMPGPGAEKTSPHMERKG